MLDGKSILITGANRGIGLETAKLCREYGAEVWLAGRDEKAIVECATALGAQHIVYDVADEDAVKAAFLKMQKGAGQLDGFVNNAGIMTDSPLQMTRLADLREMINVNIIAAYQHLQLASRLMSRKKKGSIVNLCSVVGDKGSTGQTAYATTKSAINGLTKSAAKELAPLNIRVNGVSPGFINTDLTASYDDIKRQAVIDRIGLKRAGLPSEVAEQICFLLSDKSSYITGQILSVDGGIEL